MGPHQPTSLGPDERAHLRRSLLARFPFLHDTDLGPRSVAAGECDRCGGEPRMVQPCGPPPTDLPDVAGPDWALGRRCAIEAGIGGWCSGHATEAEAALAWLGTLPAQADLIARLWWLATGEVRPDPSLTSRARAMLSTPPPT